MHVPQRCERCQLNVWMLPTDIKQDCFNITWFTHNLYAQMVKQGEEMGIELVVLLEQTQQMFLLAFRMF